MALCIDAMGLCFGHSGDSDFPRSTKPRAHRWREALADLTDWYACRPPELCAIAEMDIPGEPFPMLFFASGAGKFSNTMYHTGMLLLLHHRPRTIQIDDRKSAQMSPLWHARRICGIAVNNERKSCLDPCLLGAFYQASRRMTHESQQQEITDALKRVKAMGWHLDSLERALRQEWNPESE